MSYQLTPLERYETELGCLVETQRQTTAHGLELEHVTLSTPQRDYPSLPTSPHDEDDPA